MHDSFDQSGRVDNNAYPNRYITAKAKKGVLCFVKTELKSFPEFYQSVCNDDLVFMFGTGISAALTGERFSWYNWIADGISSLKDSAVAEQLKTELDADSSADNLIAVVGKVLSATKTEGSYSMWMHQSFETACVTNASLARTLKKLTVFNDVFATTNYDLLLESATGIKSLSYEQPDKVFAMLQSGRSDAVLHIHGIYDSVHRIDSIVADKEQYAAVLNDKGAQFIQNLLGTRTLVFVGCGKTTEDVNIKQFIEFARRYLKIDRTYYFLYNSSSPVDGLPDNIQLIPYGDDFADLTDFLEDLAVERIQHRIASSRVIGRTAFDNVSSSRDSILRFHYSQRAIPFYGRDNEISRVNEFINTEEPFTWWAVTGQAGSGKSRLAYEFINQLPSSWFGFFLGDRSEERDIDGFVAFCNTAIVIDYVAGRERFVAECMNRFYDRFATTNYKLRILLLERENTRSIGSWYSKLLQRSVSERLKASEYDRDFLYLEDLERNAVESIISCVCVAQGLEEDPYRDSELYDIYSRKFERLRFRPLYLQLFVEAWIGNGCNTPKYDGYTGLLEDMLKREQEKWLLSVDNDQEVCNSCVRLLIRANIAPIEVDRIPDLYKKDWETVQKYIASHSFIGKQKSSLQDSLLNSLCQNIDRSHAIIAPQFPDIIKEYMFSYYTEPESLPDVMREIWLHASAAFSIFITKCLMDFEDQDFYKQAINAYNASTVDTDVLMGRLSFLQNRLIQKGEDPRVFWDLIDNEHAFWTSVTVPDGDEGEKDRIATLKVAGLYKVAQHIGAWSVYDVSSMIEVIDEMMEVQGGAGTQFMKKILLQKSIRELSTSSFFEASKYLRGKLDCLIGESPEDEFDSLLQMQNYNDEMMRLILMDEFDKAKNVLFEMSEKCNIEDISSAQVLAHSCFNINALSFQLEHPSTIGAGLPIVGALETRYPDDWTIRARRIGCQVAVLQKHYFSDDLPVDEIKAEADKLDSDLSSMSFNGSESDEALGIAWGSLKTLEINFASQQEIEAIIKEAEEVLKTNKRLPEVIGTAIIGIRALHKKYLFTKISHAEVERLFKYVEANPDSGSVRNEFFEMLGESEDAGKTSDYLNQNLLREAFQDAKYNPIMGSGIPEIDLQEAILEDLLTVKEPYIRGHRKIGRNEPCPCGSGKKFKRCCIGKGIYD